MAHFRRLSKGSVHSVEIVMNRSNFVAAIAVLLFAASPLMAQPERYTEPRPPVLCPFPITRTLTAPPPSLPTPNPIDFTGTLSTAVAGSVWNQTAVNHGFGHSFAIPDLSKECCVWTKAILIVKVKALQAGSAGSATSSNDWLQLIYHGASVPGTGQQPFAGGATFGQTQLVTVNIPQNILSSGIVSFHVQDDTAVLSAELRLEGCCIRPLK
jgi:hypothetical protein